MMVSSIDRSEERHRWTTVLQPPPASPPNVRTNNDGDNVSSAKKQLFGTTTTAHRGGRSSEENEQQQRPLLHLADGCCEFESTPTTRTSPTATSDNDDEVQESRGGGDTKLASSLSSLTRGWGMERRPDSRLAFHHARSFIIGRQRGSISEDESEICNDSTPFDRPAASLSLSSSTSTKIDRRRAASDRPTTWSAVRKSKTSFIVSKFGFFSVIACLLVLLTELTSTANAFSSSCVAEQCAGDFMRALDHDKVLLGSNVPFCTLLSNYGSCLNRTSRACRGNLKYHSLNTMVMTQFRDHNCAVQIEMHRKLGSAPKSPKFNGGSGGKPIKQLNSSSQTDGGIITTDDDSNGGMGGGGGAANNGRCLFPYQHQKGSGGYRYCSMFGDPHLRTFEGQYETCRTLGAWPLMDNGYFGVQVTNDPVADGVDASGISKVTVIVKSLPGCTDQKMFEATRDYLPPTFVDGTTNSGDPNTNSISGASYYVASSAYDRADGNNNEGGSNNNGNGEHHRPAVLIRTLEVDRHIEINLRYISTRVVIRRAGNYLTVAIKIPEEVLVQRSSQNTLQLCLTGCPSAERINYKEVLAYPGYYVKKWGVAKPAIDRDQAAAICRDAGATDFFFDSCVFDLLMTGDESFKESAVAAMNDIRHLYPPYRKHYETRRADLQLYEELAKIGRDLEYEEREHGGGGHKRRQPAGPPFGDDQQAQNDQRAFAQLGESVSRARTSRTNSASASAASSVSRSSSFTIVLLFCLFLVRALRRHCSEWS